MDVAMDTSMDISVDSYGRVYVSANYPKYNRILCAHVSGAPLLWTDPWLLHG